MDKKGLELSYNTIILGILVVIVLVVVVVFFIGGFSTVSGKIKNFLGVSVAGTDFEVAISGCQSRCERAKALPENLRHTSAYCTSSFLIDYQPVSSGGDGKADTILVEDRDIPIRYFCDQGSANLRYDQGSEEVMHLGLSCPGVVCR